MKWVSFQINSHDIIISQKYLPSVPEENFSTNQQGKFLHIDKGLSPRRNKVLHIEELVCSLTTLQRVASHVIKNHADTPLST